jgi:PAS domain S-box-containing protein
VTLRVRTWSGDVETVELCSQPASGDPTQETSWRSYACSPMELVDRDGTYLFMNETHLSRLGSPVDKVIGKTYGESHSLDDTKEFVGTIGKIFETGEALQLEHRSLRDDRYFLRTLSPVKDPDGNTISVTAVSKDITELKRTEKALQDKISQLNVVLSHAPLVLSAVNLEGMFILSQGKGLESLGRKPEQFVGVSVFDLYKDSNPEILEYVRRAMTGESVNAIVELGGEFFDVNYEPIKDVNGKISGVVAVSNIITARKLAEEERTKLEDQLHRAQRMESMGLMAGGYCP